MNKNAYVIVETVLDMYVDDVRCSPAQALQRIIEYGLSLPSSFVRYYYQPRREIFFDAGDVEIREYIIETFDLPSIAPNFHSLYPKTYIEGDVIEYYLDDDEYYEH